MAGLDDPDRYLPAFSGNDVVLAKDDRKAVPGKRKHGLTYADRIYLFATEDSLQRFAQNPEAYVTADGTSPMDSGAKAAANSDGWITDGTIDQTSGGCSLVVTDGDV